MAAGMSQRAGSNKLLWMVEGRTLIEHALHGMAPHVEHIYVVTGPYHAALTSQLIHWSNITLIYNDQHLQGMFTSVKKGVAFSHPCSDVLILPGDCPFVKDTTYLAMAKPHETMAVPRYDSRRGHPIFIPSRLKAPLLLEPDSSHLKHFRNTHGFVEIPTDDAHIIIDIDTIEDFNQSLDATRKDERL